MGTFVSLILWLKWRHLNCFFIYLFLFSFFLFILIRGGKSQIQVELVSQLQMRCVEIKIQRWTDLPPRPNIRNQTLNWVVALPSHCVNYINAIYYNSMKFHLQCCLLINNTNRTKLLTIHSVFLHLGGVGGGAVFPGRKTWMVPIGGVMKVCFVNKQL